MNKNYIINTKNVHHSFSSEQIASLSGTLDELAKQCFDSKGKPLVLHGDFISKCFEKAFLANLNDRTLHLHDCYRYFRSLAFNFNEDTVNNELIALVSSFTLAVRLINEKKINHK